MNVLLVTAAGYDLYKISVPDEIQIWCKKATELSSKYVKTCVIILVSICIVTKIALYFYWQW